VSLVKRAELNGITVGLAMLKELGKEVGYIYYLAVLPEFRRRRVGSKLVDDALSLFASRGASCVYATVELDNEPSMSLFRSKGFVETRFEDMSNLHGRLRAVQMMYEMRAAAGEVVLRKALL
jgi:ribosomal protein S18 acetylase RimI-like enzyme